MSNMINLENVWKIYQMGEVEVPALCGVNLKIKKGEFVAIMGASGSGKSTMMNLIGCLDKPTKGKIELMNKDISKLEESDLASLRGKTIGFIFQQYNLMHDLSALDNVKLSLELQEYDDDFADKRAKEVLEIVGLSDKINNYPKQLSGGQQQRVSIARSLVANPDMVLADEPTGALDSKTGKRILDTLKTLWKDEEKTIVVITHDANIAKYAERQINLVDGQIVN